MYVSNPVLNPSKTGIGEVIDIFWTINDPPGLQGLNDGDQGSCSHILDHKRPTRTSGVK